MSNTWIVLHTRSGSVRYLRPDLIYAIESHEVWNGEKYEDISRLSISDPSGRDIDSWDVRETPDEVIGILRSIDRTDQL